MAQNSALEFLGTGFDAVCHQACRQSFMNPVESKLDKDASKNFFGREIFLSSNLHRGKVQSRVTCNGGILAGPPLPSLISNEDLYFSLDSLNLIIPTVDSPFRRASSTPS